MKRESRGGRTRRYGRVARVLLENDALPDEELARRADVHINTVKYCREAFTEIREAFVNHGWGPR
jgi:hypothetical protein